MRRLHHLVEGVLQPEEIGRLQEIFDKIAAATWFDASECSRETLAIELIHLYRGGVTNLDRLHDLAISATKARVGRQTPRPASEEEKEAYELGIEAGRQHRADSPNPYPENSSLAKAYENGLLDGQKLN